MNATDENKNVIAIDSGNKTWITLTEASKLLPVVKGRRINTSTLWRWCKKGFRGIYLDYARIGKIIVTSQESLGRFFTQLAEQEKNAALAIPPTRAYKKLRRQSDFQMKQRLEQAETILRKAKIIT